MSVNAYNSSLIEQFTGLLGLDSVPEYYLPVLYTLLSVVVLWVLFYIIRVLMVIVTGDYYGRH